jgi:adenylosuccinate lyase
MGALSFDLYDLALTPATAVSSIDGRYADKTKDLRHYFSEYALQRERTIVEVENLIALGDDEEITHVRPLKPAEKTFVRGFYRKFYMNSFNAIKHIEYKDGFDPRINDGKKTKHDVAAVVNYIKWKMMNKKGLEDLVEAVHWPLTSEDATSPAYARLVNSAVDDIMMPNLVSIIYKLRDLSVAYAAEPMLAHTHGQPASPTTVGKELIIYANELATMAIALKENKIPAKMNGATGNFNAQRAAYPKKDWIRFYGSLLKKMGLEQKQLTSQVCGYTEYASLFHKFAEVNTYLAKIDLDSWIYISFDYFKQKKEEGQVGSSTMAHKINPIDFENSEGNVIPANALFNALAEALPRTRLQRDLSGSTMLRAMGEAFGHSLLSYKSLRKALDSIEPNLNVLKLDLESHPEIMSEPLQIIMRKEGLKDTYSQLRSFTQGKKVTLDEMNDFIDSLKVSDEIKQHMKEQTPLKYIGDAISLTEKGTAEVNKKLVMIEKRMKTCQQYR